MADAKASPKNRWFGSATYRSVLREYLRNGQDDPTYPHPLFLERVMGFPDGWTELPALETRSSPRSPK